MIQALRTFIGGLLMGAADLVPGVSGGTIALVIGIYERLIGSVREGSSALGSLLRGRTSAFSEHFSRVEWLFLLPLLAGILGAVLTLSNVIEHQLEANPTIMAGFFLGLVAGSVAVAWRLVRFPTTAHIVVVVTVGAALFALLGLGGDSVVTGPSLSAFFGAGALAICAMILPGISGSLLLLLIGMYAAVLAAVNSRDFLAVGVFVAGAIVGLALFSQLLHWALRRHHDMVLAALVGLMVGSSRILWPWPQGVDSAALGAPGEDWLTVAAAALAGLVVVFVIARLEPAADEVKDALPPV